MRMLPYSLGASLASMPAAWSIAYWQRRTRSTIGLKVVVVTGLGIAATGFGMSVIRSQLASMQHFINCMRYPHDKVS